MKTTNKLKLLELFAGSRSIGKVAENLGYEVISVDWKNYEKIDLVIDIEELKLEDIPFIPDVIWASPDCRTYSVASCGTHRTQPNYLPKTEYAEKCDKVNKHFIGLIDELLIINPKMIYFIENPRGMLRKMPFIQHLNRETIWYCQYGDLRAKPTDIWTNCTKWNPKPVCKNGNPNCHHQKAPRRSKTGTQGLKNSYERSIIPEQLCYEVLRSAIKQLEGELCFITDFQDVQKKELT